MVVRKPQEIKVALMSGGKSGERDISLASGDGAYTALCAAGFIVERLDPASKSDLQRLISESFDVAFLALHGKYGEDGTIQGMLEILGIPYTGPGVWSSATAIDKTKAKMFYERCNIPTPKALTFTEESNITPGQIVEILGEHCVIKAATEGSALGVFLCHSLEDIQNAIEKVFAIDHKALAEQFIQGDEYTVAVLGNDTLQALPVVQIIPSHEFYDFESKYAPGGSQHLCPAPLNDKEAQRAQQLALEAHRALECTGVSRTDLIKDTEGNFWVLETNTLPGMTETSLLPDAARAAGISFPELCTQLIALALEQQYEQQCGF